MRLINEIKRSRKRPKYILIYIMSRFSRTGGNAIALANMLVEDMGVHLIETSSGLNTETDIGKMSIYQKLIEARKETLSRLDSTIPGMKNALMNGKWLGNPPRGYSKFGPRVKDPERFAHKSRVEINKEGKFLKKAWKWKLEGDRDVDIVRKLSLKGYEIDKKRLSDMWRKPFYAGIIVHSLIDEIVKGDWEPMVSMKDFVKINNILEEENNREGYRIEKEIDPRPLNGSLKCGECGANLTGYEKKKKKKSGEIYLIHYYRCYNCNAIHTNANTTVKSTTEGLHNQFMKLLGSIKFEKRFLKAIEIGLLKIVNHQNEDAKKEAKEYKKQLTEFTKELDIIEQRFAFGKIPEKIYLKFSKELEQNVIELERKLSERKFSTANQSEMIKLLVDKFQKLDKIWETGSLSFKKSLQNLLFPNGMVVESDSKQLRTSNINELFKTIASFSESCKQKNSGLSKVKFDKSALVADYIKKSNQTKGRFYEDASKILNFYDYLGKP